jgi:hypothetical protein
MKLISALKLIRSEIPRSFGLAIGGVEKRLAGHCMFRQVCRLISSLILSYDICIRSPMLVINGVKRRAEQDLRILRKGGVALVSAGYKKMDR